MDLKSFFEINNKVAVAFSGGVDSSFLLYAAVNSGADVTAYYVKSQFQPDFEFRDAKTVADRCGATLRVIEIDVLSEAKIRSNPADRCYYCKNVIMGSILQEARRDGYDLVIDGTNASDDTNDRPGFRALRELAVRSPLRECGITKSEVRRLAHEAGLHVWNKPAYACLATRIPHGEAITAEKLSVTEKAESILYDMGYRDFRVRMRGENALVQICSDQHSRALSEHDRIEERLSALYGRVDIDETARQGQ